MRIVITGATGYLGRRLVSRGAEAGHDIVPTSRSLGLDIRSRAAVAAFVADVRPDAVIHTASARSDWAVMADGAAHMAAASAGVRFVHVSTDAIFPGRAAEYDESARPDPLYSYGAAKAAAETAVLAVAPSAAVVRTSMIVGGGDGAHETLVHDMVAGRFDGVLLTDMIRKPVHVEDLADALLELAVSDYAGILNVAGADAINRYDLGVRIALRDGLDPAALKAGTIAEHGLRLPAEVRLDITRARSVLRTRLRGVDEFLPAGSPSGPGSAAEPG